MEVAPWRCPKRSLTPGTGTRCVAPMRIGGGGGNGAPLRIGGGGGGAPYIGRNRPNFLPALLGSTAALLAPNIEGGRGPPP